VTEEVTMTRVMERRELAPRTLSAAVVIGLEPGLGAVSLAALTAVSERLARSIRPWDTIVALGPGTVGVLCNALGSPREVEAVAARLVDAVRAPLAVGDEIEQLGACHGAAVMNEGENEDAVFSRAREAMEQMRATRAQLLGNDTP
jgi:GGDEF domain-containing protein